MAYGSKIINRSNESTIEDKYETFKVVSVGWTSPYWNTTDGTSPTGTTGQVTLPSGVTQDNVVIFAGIQNARGQVNKNRYEFGIQWVSTTKFQFYAPLDQDAFPQDVSSTHIRYLIAKIGDNSDATTGDDYGLTILTSDGGVAFRSDRVYMNTEGLYKSSGMQPTMFNVPGYSAASPAYLKHRTEITQEGYWFLMNDTARYAAIWDTRSQTSGGINTTPGHGKYTYHPFVSIRFADPSRYYGPFFTFEFRKSKKESTSASGYSQMLWWETGNSRGTIIGVLR